MQISFKANESLKYGARLTAVLLRADIFTQSDTLSLWMKSSYLAVDRGVCARALAFWPIYVQEKEGQLLCVFVFFSMQKQGCIAGTHITVLCFIMCIQYMFM